MPYRIFKESDGYAVWKVDDGGKKIERKNKKGYKSRSEALPYLKALYSHENDAKASEEVIANMFSTDDEVTPNPVTASTELVLGSVHLEADAENPRFLRFHDAVLARAETNSNRDDLDEDGINELAATIAGTHIDHEHNIKKNIGFYTSGRNDSGALRVDGVVWLDACEAFGIDPTDIENGTYKLSIEAEAKTAECSVCHSIHTDISTYCQHLKAKAVHGARRILRGLKAVGGAITLKPAGSSTEFSGVYFVASHQEEQEQTMENELTASEIEFVEEWISAAISKREDVSPADKKRAEKEYGDVEYADEKNKKYPLDKDHVHAAWSYVNMPKNAAKYSPEELKTIKNKIRRAAKKYGMEISDDKKSKTESSKESDMDDMHKEMDEPADEEKKETPEEEKKENETEGNMGVEYKKMKKDMDTMMAELEAKKADLANEQTAKATLTEKVTSLEARVQSLEAALQTARTEVKASRVTTLKQQLVGSVMTEEEFTADEEKLLAMDETTIALLIKAATKKSESTETKKPENRVLASEQAPGNNGRVKFVL